MQTTSISIPTKLEQQVKKQIKEGKFSSTSEFISLAVQTYLRLQKGKLSWGIISAPFRAYARQKNLTEKDLLLAVEKGRHARPSKSSK